MTEKEQEQKLQAMSQINAYDFGYKPGTGITIPAELFMAMMDHSGAVAQKETQELVEVVSFEIGSQPQTKEPKTVRVYTSGLGMRSEQLFNELMNIHYENIDKGLTVPIGEPKLDLGEEPQV